MAENQLHTIFTIGHSTDSLEALVAMLHVHQVQQVVDIRRYPGSAKFPQFNRDSLQRSLPPHGIKYYSMEALGGRRRPEKDSLHTAWRHLAFRGYADYMDTPYFQKAIRELENLASQSLTAIMCSERLWWRCHRALVADWLKAAGWQVWHILSLTKVQEHPYTTVARMVEGRPSYLPEK